MEQIKLLKKLEEIKLLRKHRTSLPVIRQGYHAVGFGLACPICHSHNTSYSCFEMNHVCFDCGEIFSSVDSLGNIINQRQNTSTAYQTNHTKSANMHQQSTFDFEEGKIIWH